MIINRVSRLLGERRESVMDLTRSTGLSYTTAHDFYSGKAKRIDLTTLDKLCQHFGVGAGDILEYVADDTPEPHGH